MAGVRRNDDSKAPKRGKWRYSEGLESGTGFGRRAPEPDDDEEELFSLDKETKKPAEIKPSRKYGKVEESDKTPTRRYWFKQEPAEDDGEEDDPNELPDPTRFFGKPKIPVNAPIDLQDDDSYRASRRPRDLRAEIANRPEVPEMDEIQDFTAADISLRTDRFIKFLTLACGYSALSVPDCFTSRPPLSCTTYAEYSRYLAAAPMSMLNEVDDALRRMSDDALNLEICINLPDGHPLRSSTSQFAGVKIRKVFLDNPIRSVATQTSSIIYLRDENRISKRFIRDVERYLSDTRTGRMVDYNRSDIRHVNWVGYS